MEPLGAAASAITIFQTVSSLARLTKELYQLFQAAPQELEACKRQIQIIEAEIILLQRLEDVCTRKGDSLEQLAVGSALELAHESIASVATECTRLTTKTSTRKRILWVLMDRDRVERLFSQLARAEKSLGLVLQLQSHKCVIGMSTNIVAILGSVERLQQTEMIKEAPRQDITRRVPMPATQQTGSIPAATSLELHIKRLGLAATLVKSTRDSGSTDYSVSFRFTTILPSYLISRVLWLELSFRKFPLSGVLQLSAGGVAFARIVSQDAAVLEAYEAGDMESVVLLLGRGEARLTDTTSNGLTLMACAIHGGNLNLVTFLLDNGISPNWTFGKLQTSPLQWAIRCKQIDIARLLITRGADTDHVSVGNWNPVFYCWPVTRKEESCSLGFLNLLTEFGPQEMNFRDCCGWTVLYRAAAFGRPDEIDVLIEMGADPTEVALPLKWNAIHHAVYHGNHATFERLLNYLEEDVTQLVDKRGWTLLHIAASAGHYAIVRHLLDLGADPTALSQPFTSHMPDVLFHRRCTPLEVAEAQSVERKQQFLVAVRESMPSTFGLEEGYREKDEQFHDTLEFFGIYR